MSPALVACVHLVQFQLHVARRAHQHARGPLAIAAHAADRALLVDCCPRAAAAGVRPGMFVWDARRRCPTLVVCAVDPAAVAQAAERVAQVLAQHADQVDQVRGDCWLLPLVALGPRFSRAEQAARHLHHDVVKGAELPCVVGVSARPGVARIAATTAQRTNRPTLVVLPGAEPTFLAPLPVEHLPGVGQRTHAALARLGISTVGQLATLPAAVLERAVGARGRILQLQAQGLDRGTAAAEPTIAANWQTRSAPSAEPHRLRAQLATVLEQIGRSLRSQHTAAGTVAIAVTWTDGTTTHRTVRLRPRGDLDHELVAVAWSALEPLLQARRLGVVQLAASAGQLGPREQELFAVDNRRVRQLQHAVDSIKERWGPCAIQHASMLGLVTPKPVSLL